MRWWHRKGTYILFSDAEKRVSALDRFMEMEKAQVFILFIALSLLMKSYPCLDIIQYFVQPCFQ